MFQEIDTVVFDLDGTLYCGNTLIDGALEVIEHCQNQGKKIFYLTNTSFKKRASVVEKLNNFSISCELNQVYTSGYISGIYIKDQKIKHPFLFGSDELKEEFAELGIALASETEAENLIMAFHPKSSFEELSAAFRVALKAEKIYAVNIDRSVPFSAGLLVPGSGAFVKAIEYSANRSVDEVIGKPNPFMIELLIRDHQLSRENIVMIGDSYESDILMSHNASIRSILISDHNFKNTYTIPNIKNLLTLL
jgi:HAD superfamily hydrolase (TIGR01450 family)